ncbi:MAG: hypothetical protein K8H84_15370 [Sulfuricella denitrificans]|nr:hypothetical protein [Sulfuricella denitrificans]
MKQWIGGTFQLGTVLLALLALAQWPALADTGPGSDVAVARQVTVGAMPAHLSWMMEQHWRVVNGQ